MNIKQQMFSLDWVSRYTQKRRYLIHLGLVCILLISTFTLSNTFAAGQHYVSLNVAEQSSKTQSQVFNNPQLTGMRYVFVDVPDAKYVEFRIDGKLVNRDDQAPFDLGSTSADGIVSPFDFSQLQAGSHKLRITPVYGFFNFENIDYTFTVSQSKTITDAEVPVSTTNTKPIVNTTIATVPVSTTVTTTAQNNVNQKKREWIIYSSDQDTATPELFISRVDGSQKRQLTNDPNYTSTWPRVTSDGKTVYFYRVPPGTMTNNYFEYSLWSINTDGTGLKQIYPKGFNGWWLQGHVDISPDDKSIVFAAIVPFKGMVLYTADMDGSNLKQIPTKQKTPIDPAWTPDGRILFTATPEGQEEKNESLEVFITTPSGQGEKRLTFDNVRDHDPVMSPDLKKVAILTYSDPAYMFPGKWTQRILDLETNNVTTLIGPDNFSANPYWVSNDTTVYAYWDWNLAGWGIKVSKIDGSSTQILVQAQKAKGLTTAAVENPFAFNM